MVLIGILRRTTGASVCSGCNLCTRYAHGQGTSQGVHIDMGAYEYGSQPVSEVLYVDVNAPAQGTGRSWEHALDNLQSALQTANLCAGRVKQIRVAEGIYIPSTGGKDLMSTFRLLNGVELLGGFPTGGGTFENRDPNRYVTILSGDRSFNDTDCLSYTCSNRKYNSRHVITAGKTNETAILDGFVIRSGNAHTVLDDLYGGGLWLEYGSPVIRNCIFTQNTARKQGSGVACFYAEPTFEQCSIQGNFENDWYALESTATVIGTLDLQNADLVAQSAHLTGPGTVILDANSLMDMRDSEISCHVQGPGRINVPLDSSLVLKDDAVLDMSNQHEGENGSIQCHGLLNVRDQAVIMDADVEVYRATVEDQAILYNCVVQAESGSPFGQFYVEDQAALALDTIWSDGDRYLDLNPEALNNDIMVNGIYVDITEGVHHTQGGLFELRGQDLSLEGQWYDTVCVVSGKVPDFSVQTWTLESLTLTPDSKLNLTNRFDFQPPYDQGGAHEVLYVRTLTLQANAVLNTCFNKVYCEQLIMDPTAEIVNVPLLGFSLNNVSFDHEHDYIARVLTNNVTGQAGVPSRMNVTRVLDQAPDPNGLMQMITLKDTDPGSRTYGQVIPAQAQALFARSSETEILVRFEFLFKKAPLGTRLNVYLTDSPELLNPQDPNWSDHTLAVAQVTPPPAGFPGSVGSGTMVVFQALVSKGQLDFSSGTRMVFELVGPEGACVWINNWDPGIRCVGYCGDVANPMSQVNVNDFFAAVSEIGRPIDQVQTRGNTQAFCLDGFFCEDGLVTHHDAMAIDFLSGQQCTCLQPLVPDFIVTEKPNERSLKPSVKSQFSTLEEDEPVTDPELLILGKMYQADISDFLKEGVFSFGPDEVSTLTESLDSRLNHKLVTNAQGDLFVLNLLDGLVGLADEPVSVLASQIIERDTDQVYVGYHELGSQYTPPMLDAAFDAQGNLYVVPVTVVSPQAKPYQCAARFTISGLTGEYALETLYACHEPGLPIQGLRELALDQQGHVYVTNVDQIRKLDSLWVFDVQTGERVNMFSLCDEESALYVPGPIGLCVDDQAERIYLASSIQEPNATEVGIYSLPMGDCVNGAGEEPNMPEIYTIQGMGHVVDMVKHPEASLIQVVGVTLPHVPTERDINSGGLLQQESPFYKPSLAVIDGSSLEVPAWCAPDYDPIQGSELSWPMSAVFLKKTK